MLNSFLSTEFDKLFWAVFQTSKNLLAVTDTKNRIHIAVNDAWAKALQYDPQDVIGKTAHELNIWGGKGPPEEILRKLNAGELLENLEVQLYAKDGSIRHGLISAQSVTVNEEALYIFSVEDITEFKQINEELSNSREMLISALESINEGFVLYGADGGLVICNSKFKEFYGYSDEEAAVGAHRKYLGQLDIERKTVIVENEKTDSYINRREKVDSSPPKSFEVKLRDGRILLLSDRKTPDGGVVSVQNDITSSRKVEDALRRSQKMEAIGQLTGGIAHDFNNILSIVLGNLELIEDIANERHDIQNLASSALKGALRGAEITKKLLNFSSMPPSQAVSASVNELLENMEHLIARSLTASIKVDLILAEDVWNIDVDTGDFEDAILNLSLNARDALDGEGKLTIETVNSVFDKTTHLHGTEIQAGEYVEITISDTGCGISEEVKEKIFDPFFTTKEKGKGTGLGLSMVYGFAQRSGGHISVWSELGAGTSVKIYLPRSAEKIENDTLPDQPISNLKGNETILIVDDEASLVDIAGAMLAKYGYKILTASSSTQALQILKDPRTIDLLFTDVIMPGGINGYQLAQQAVKINPDLKILVASGYTAKEWSREIEEDDLVRSLSENLLQKPYKRDVLITKIRELLD